MKYCVIVASNSDEILRTNLAASPDLGVVEMSVQRGAISAAQAYNRGIQASRGDIMIFAHQDMYLPAGWLASLEQIIADLDRQQTNWGVLGMFGVTHSGTGQGHVYSTGLERVLGAAFPGVREIGTLDEILLIVRRSSGLEFDENLPGFHLYGTDICMEAKIRGLKNYVMANFGIHNSNGIPILPRNFWQSYAYLQKKWQSQLPITTPCIRVTRGNATIWKHVARSLPRVWFTQEKKGKRVPDPVALLPMLSAQLSPPPLSPGQIP